MRFIFIAFILFLTACSKPNPTPELLDPIYLDIQTNLTATQKSLAEAQVMVKQYELEEKAVAPQTGQIKYAKKHLYESLERVNKLKQEVKYLELRLKTRLREDRKNYYEAYKNKKTWPDPKEWNEYKEKQRLMITDKNWNIDIRNKQLDAIEKRSDPQDNGEK